MQAALLSLLAGSILVPVSQESFSLEINFHTSNQVILQQTLAVPPLILLPGGDVRPVNASPLMPAPAPSVAYTSQ